MGRSVSRSSLARTNQDRDYHIFEEYAYHLVNEARKKRVVDIFKLDGSVFAFDSTTIDLCLSVFWWAKFRKKKGGIKVHTLYD
ncbi:MAG: IS4 family transposase, partial [Tissierellia bacterium]|nr:IS4 family transposase [Tissierellia bacterium]